MARSIIGRLALAALALATVSCAYLDQLGREVIFRPQTADWAGYSPDILSSEEVWVPVGGNGERLHGWWLETPGAQYTLVYFHGARVNLTGSVYRIRGFRSAGYNVFAIDYRGYGKSSPGLPSEESAYEDAEAAWKWLDARVPDRRKRILYGHSLGAPIAAEVALRDGGNAAALVIESGFTSIAEMSVLSGLVSQRMDLLDKLSRLTLPVLIVHGTEDKIVPPEMSRRLYEAARGPKRLIMVEGAGHSWVARRAGGRMYEALQELAAGPR
jgi:alpha-beta hydrolase superfamily lysophospholipase